MIDVMIQQNASNFAKFLEYGNWHTFFVVHFQGMHALH